MTNRAIASRYAKALLEVSLKEGDPREVERDLASFVELMTSHEGTGGPQGLSLRQVLTNPAVPTPKKQAIVQMLVERGQPTPIVARTLVLLASRDRLALLAELLGDYRERLLDREGIVRAEVATAVPLAPEKLQNIERGLAAATGKRISMAARVDPSMIGGVIARVGSTVYDGSVTTMLKKMRETITGAQ
jgi:F-type H+-transporting ATPase subunit delta